MRILKIHSLPPTKDAWIDRDQIMLHACFQILEDFIEKENGLEEANYEFYKESVDTCRELYNWWQENKKTVSIDSLEADEMLLKLIKIRGFLWT